LKNLIRVIYSPKSDENFRLVFLSQWAAHSSDTSEGQNSNGEM